MEAQIFKALGDPVRLEIVKRLATGSTYSLGEITDSMSISRQGARKQIQVLVSAKIVYLQPIGREVRVSLDMNSLKLMKQFITRIENQWDKRLNKLKNFVEKK